MAVAADAWAGIVAMLGALAFVSSHLLLRDFQWGISMCLAGTVFCFFTVKAQYVHFLLPLSPSLSLPSIFALRSEKTRRLSKDATE